MLDDGQFVHGLDKGNALGVIAGQPSQLCQEFDFNFPRPAVEIRNIVLAGMGGSALAAEFVRAWLGDRLPVPVVISREYALPGFVDKHTLLIASSYSGNTEETLAEEAQRLGAQLVIMSSGGELQKRAEAGQLPFIKLPSGYQPRLAVFFGVRAIAELLEKTGLAKGLVQELVAAAEPMIGQASNWIQDTPTSQNQAKQLAQEIFGNSAVIYSGPTLGFAAHKWKININENAKNVAFYYELPEFSHNEFTGWLFPQTKPIKVIELQSSLDHPQINKRFEISNRLLSGKMPTPLTVNAAGKTKLDQLLWTILLGDFVSAYLAFLNGIDPTPVDLIEKLKKELK